jgi:hypothetical protein
MRKTLMLLCVLVMVACGRKSKEKEKVKEERIEITPFIVTKMILKDTTQLKTIYAQTDSGRISVSDYKEYVDDLPMYLDKLQFKNFENAMWDLVRNPGSMVFSGSDKPITKAALRERVIQCDSIKEVSYDAKGEEVVKLSFMCDSTTSIHNINMIRFAETWYFNKANNMIEREILGYSVFQWVPEKMGFRSLFEVYPSEESRKRAKKYDFW